MRRVFIIALALASVCFGREFKPNEKQISDHRALVYELARSYVVGTFNLTVIEASHFNPVRFNSSGVWGSFDCRMKELGEDRYEVKGWLTLLGHEKPQIPWSVVITLPLEDPEAWRYRRLDSELAVKPVYHGWRFGDYRSIGYDASYSAAFLAAMQNRGRRY